MLTKVHCVALIKNTLETNDKVHLPFSEVLEDPITNMMTHHAIDKLC